MKQIQALAFLILASLATAVSAQGPTPSTSLLFAFPCDATSVCADGYFPISLIESADGNFYGAAAAGGSGRNAQGTIFKISPSGQLSVVYSFAEQPDGSLPNGAAPDSLVEGTDGFLYGVTLVDGANGFGTVFKLSKSGVIQDLHDFCNTQTCSDGANPGFLMQAMDGNFYGATGGLPPASVLFRMSPAGTFKVLHTFDTTQKDGTGVFGMIQATDGNFYGTTVAGVQSSPFNSVFRLTPSGTYTILHGFTQNQAASSPLIQASNGQLFGLQNGSNLFQISLAGKYHEIGGLSTTNFSDGDILQASDGNLWGDFTGGDCSGQGIAFAATTAGSVLQNLVFNCATIGEQLGTIVQGADGKLYGVTFGSGVATTNDINNGTVWVIDAGLPAPAPGVVGFSLASGKVGVKVLIQGSHFVGTTAVAFNGVPAAFQVLSVNYVSATVPAGATTGPISVTNGGGTTISTKSFTVQLRAGIECAQRACQDKDPGR